MSPLTTSSAAVVRLNMGSCTLAGKSVDAFYSGEVDGANKPHGQGLKETKAMKKSQFTDQQIAFAAQQAKSEYSRRGPARSPKPLFFKDFRKARPAGLKPATPGSEDGPARLAEKPRNSVFFGL